MARFPIFCLCLLIGINYVSCVSDHVVTKTQGSALTTQNTAMFNGHGTTIFEGKVFYLPLTNTTKIYRTFPAQTETILRSIYEWVLLFASSYLVYATIVEIGDIHSRRQATDGQCNFVSYRKTKSGFEKKNEGSRPLIVTAGWGTNTDTQSGGGKHDFSSSWGQTEKGSKRERDNDNRASGKNGKENSDDRHGTVQPRLKPRIDEDQCECWEASKHDKQCSGRKVLNPHGGYLSKF